MLIKYAFFVFIIIALAILAFTDAPLGHATLGIIGLSLKTNLAGAVLIGLMIYLAVVLTIKVVAFPSRLRLWLNKRHAKAAADLLREGVEHALNGHVRMAHKQFVRAAKQKDKNTAQTALLLAVYCALRMGRLDDAYDGLRKAQELDAFGTTTSSVLLARTHATVASGEAMRSGELRALLDEHGVDDDEVVALLRGCRVHGDADETTALRELLMSLQTTAAPRAQKVIETVSRELFDRAVTDGRRDEIEEIWRSADSPLREVLLPDYARAMSQLGEEDVARALLEEAIEKGYSAYDAASSPRMDVYVAYGGLNGDHERRLDEVRRWLEKEPESTNLLLAQGMIYRRMRMYDQAMDCLERCYARAPTPEAAHEIALTLADKKAYRPSEANE